MEPPSHRRPEILPKFVKYCYRPAYLGVHTLKEWEEFLNAEGRRERRLIGIPWVQDRPGYEMLFDCVSDLIETNHQPSILAALSSIEVDLSYLYHRGLFGSDFRTERRLWAQFARLLEFSEGHSEFTHSYHRPTISAIEPAISTASQELAKYLATHPTALFQLRPRQFEELIADVLASFGWEVELTPPSKDGGFDILCVTSGSLTSPKMSYIVECKKYSPNNKVGIEVARQLLFTKSNLNVGSAMIVTTSDFTKGVYDFQKNRLDFDARNFSAVVEWCRHYGQQRISTPWGTILL